MNPRVSIQSMTPRRARTAAFTLLEMILVIGLLTILAAFVMPSLYGQLVRGRLPESARQMRALLQLTRANAMLDGYRYRVRFPGEEELDGTGDQRQPLIEVENEPYEFPEEFRPVLASWAQDAVLARGIRCVTVRLGKPTIDQILGDAEAEPTYEEDLEEDLGETFEDGFPPLIFEPDGTSEWAVFVITDADEEENLEDLDPESEDYQMIEVILDGLVGQCWLQRPLYEDELDMMQEHGWPPVLRKDFLQRRALTEENVLEIRESKIRK